MVGGHQPLADSQWQVIAWLLPLHRKRRHCLRQVLDAIRYICRTGCQWRSLPSCFPPWSAVYYYFRHWQLTGLWQRLKKVFRNSKERHAELVEASLLNNPSGTIEMLRQAQHDVLKVILVKSKPALSCSHRRRPRR